MGKSALPRLGAQSNLNLRASALKDNRRGKPLAAARSRAQSSAPYPSCRGLRPSDIFALAMGATAGQEEGRKGRWGGATASETVIFVPDSGHKESCVHVVRTTRKQKTRREDDQKRGGGGRERVKELAYVSRPACAVCCAVNCARRR